MQISTKLQLLFFFGLFILCTTVSQKSEESEENSDDAQGRAFRFHTSPPSRPCEYRRQQGFCKRRSHCKKPTRHVCRIGVNPVVCCLDEPDKITTHTAHKTTKKPDDNHETGKGIDITFPGCGIRASKNDAVAAPRNNGRTSSVLSRGRQRGIQHVIVGGVTAVPNSWPWMAAIMKEPFSGSAKRFLCGASLISKRYILTAAHCFDGENGQIVPSKFSILLGSHTTKDGIQYPVEQVLIHPEYRRRQYYNDIALIKVAKNVDLIKHKVHPVCLPSDGLRSKIQLDLNKVTVTGWGDTSFGGVSSNTLQELEIPIVPLKECNNSYSKINLSSFPRGITKLFICAGVAEGGKDACQGDSGGPLVTELKDGSWVQLGVVSFGYGCARAGFPGVYTRTSKYTKWLQDNTDLGKA